MSKVIDYKGDERLIDRWEWGRRKREILRNVREHHRKTKPPDWMGEGYKDDFAE